MSYGVSANNSMGRLLASSSSPVHHYYGKAALVSTAVYNTNPSTQVVGTYRIAGVPQTETPLVFARVPVGGNCVIGITQWNASAGAWDVLVYGSVAAAAELLVFRPLPPDDRTPAAAYGIRAMNASGAVMFDSTKAPLVISEAHTFTGVMAVPSARTLGRTYTRPAFLAYSAVQRVFAYGRGGFPGTLDLGVTNNGGSFSLAWIRTRNPSTTPIGFPRTDTTGDSINHTTLVIETAHIP